MQMHYAKNLKGDVKMFKDRIEKLRNSMKAKDLDCVLVIGRSK